MKQSEGNASERKSSEAGKPGKKPYQKPGFRYERVFETMALACGKIHPTLPGCKGNRKSS